jgi:fatty-acyl-CoA synthase
MQSLARATRRLTGAGRRAVATLTSTLGAQVDTLGDKDFLRVRHQDITWTLGEFQRHANALAEGLAEAGYRPGDTIAVWLPNDSEYLVTQFAAARLGLTFIAVDPAVEGAANVASVLRTSGCKGFLFGADGIDAVSGAVPELDAQGAESGSIKSLEFGGLAHLVTTGWHFERHGVENFKNLPVYSADALRDGFRATNVLAAIAPPAAGSALGAHFTASADGEGPPQMGAAFSHGAAVTQGTAVADTLKLTGDDVVCITAPLASPLGFAGVAGALSRTAKTVVPAADFDAVATMDAIAIEGCTVLIAEPEQLAELEALCASGAYATASVPSRRLLTL